ncbi:MAG: hypothetical protein GY777_28520, partial [Candidatus Brocadiaceae bacterium]|nr:hypothetical protein [Candidatus Brocadiaceae bacterium]
DISNLSAKISSARDRVEFNQKTIEGLDIQKEKYERSIGLLKNKIEESESSICTLNQDFRKIHEDLTEGNNRLSTKETALKQYVYEYDVLQQKIEENKKQVIDLLHRGSSLQNEVGSLSAERDTISNRKNKLLRRQEEISTELERIECQRQDLKEQRDKVLNKIGNLESSLTGTEEQIKVLNAEIQVVGDRINEMQQLRSRKESRLETLEDLEKRFEGVSSGVQVVLEEARKDSGAVSGIYGMVADLIKVDTAYVPAIEAILGDNAQMIVSGSIKEVVNAFNLLKEHDSGFVKFFPLEDVVIEASGFNIDLNTPGVVGRAVDLIKSEDDFRPLVEFVFKDTIVVEDFDTALKL